MNSFSLKTAVPAIVCALMIAGTVAGGLVQRNFGSGGTNASSLNRAALKLAQPLPERVGNWRLLSEPTLEAEVVDMLRCPAYISRIYVHDQTGHRVSVAVLLGPAGPIAVHTPEICFSSQDYTIVSDRAVEKLTDKQGTEQTFWNVLFRSNSVDNSQTRVLYAWSCGSDWEATESPRFTHSSRPYLYKLQVSGPVAEDSADFDPCQDFLSQFVTQIQPLLLSADPA